MASTEFGQTSHEFPLNKLKPDFNITASIFLDTIFADVTDEEVVCVVKQSLKDDGQSLFWQIPDDDPVFLTWLKRKSEQAFYFCVSSLRGERNEKGTALRRRSVDAVRYYCLVLDDIGDGAGSKAEAPPTDPTWEIETSEANYQYGYRLKPDTDFARYNALVKWCIDQGWCDPGADGIVRIMRLPGSCNLKPGRDNFRSRVTSWEPDRVWALDDLANSLGLESSELDRLEKAAPGKGVKPTAGGAAALDSIDPLLDWLDQAGHIVRDDGGAFVDVKCPWFERHTTGSDTAGYSPLGRGEGDWVQWRSFKCLHAHCKAKNFGKFSEWAVELGAPKVSGVDPLPWLQRKFTYIGFGSRIADLEQRPLGGRWLWEFEEWGKMHKGRVLVPGRDTPVEMKTAFLESPNTTKAVDTQYWPVRADADEPTIERAGQRLINVYTPPNWAETSEEPDIFLDHVDFLLPDDDERDLFLNWLAFKIQNPPRRSYAVVMIAEEAFGVGRSWLKTMLTAVLQGKGVNTVTLSQLVGKGTSAEANYNDWMTEAQFLIVEEAKDVSREDFYSAYENFKQIVDIRVMPVRVNPKYGRTRNDFAFFNALIFSNHSDALALPENDRRVAVLTNPREMETPAYYDALEASLSNGEPRRIYWYLMRRDVSAFDHVYPPMTPGKRLMTCQHQSPGDEIKAHIVETWGSDLVTRESLASAVIAAASALDHNKIMISPGGITRMIWGRLGPLREEKNGARYVINDERVEVRAIREKAVWMGKDADRQAETVIEELEKSARGGSGMSIAPNMG